MLELKINEDIKLRIFDTTRLINDFRTHMFFLQEDFFFKPLKMYQ